MGFFVPFIFSWLSLFTSAKSLEREDGKRIRVVVYCYFLDGDRIFRIEKLWNRLTTGVDK